MPKAGFKSITINEKIYNDLHNKYKAMKPELSKIGINSFAGFWAFTMEKFINDNDVFQAFINSMMKDQTRNFEKLRNHEP